MKRYKSIFKETTIRKIPISIFNTFNKEIGMDKWTHFKDNEDYFQAFYKNVPLDMLESWIGFKFDHDLLEVNDKKEEDKVDLAYKQVFDQYLKHSKDKFAKARARSK
jgi:hypothetical protein